MNAEFFLLLAAALLVAWVLAKRSLRIDACQRADRQRDRTRKAIADQECRLMAYDAEIADFQGRVHTTDLAEVISARNTFTRMTQAANVALAKVTIGPKKNAKAYDDLTKEIIGMPSIAAADAAEANLQQAIKKMSLACRTVQSTAVQFKEKMTALQKAIAEARASDALPEGTDAAYKSLEDWCARIQTAIDEKRLLTAHEFLASAERAGGNIEMRLNKEATRKRRISNEAVRAKAKISAAPTVAPTHAHDESTTRTTEPVGDLLLTGIVVGAILTDTSPAQADHSHHRGGGDSGGGGASSDYSPSTDSGHSSSSSSDSDSSSSSSDSGGSSSCGSSCGGGGGGGD